MLDLVLSAFMHAAAVGVLSCLVSESAIMAPVRSWLGWRVLLCPICLGFWFASPFLLMYGCVFYYFMVVAFSNVWMLIILKVYESLEATGE
jgi:hypothetical protein